MATRGSPSAVVARTVTRTAPSADRSRARPSFVTRSRTRRSPPTGTLMRTVPRTREPRRSRTRLTHRAPSGPSQRTSSPTVEARDRRSTSDRTLSRTARGSGAGLGTGSSDASGNATPGERGGVAPVQSTNAAGSAGPSRSSAWRTQPRATGS
ncbi:hypothetical protein C7Y72_12440 [Paraconexibacter algicola]|uniref:Uncharacterized protein n=1 Tax=Paraconexibacter algicola TaxID=2133960 RepID=A0A2T4UMC5_9ACTN|nr:hypothetical protein C7Y72_12440 [Paraconexibacter algicola]